MMVISPWTYAKSQEDSISMNIRVQSGGEILGKLFGKLELKANGPQDLKNMSLYFNGTEVYSTEGDSLSFVFETQNYGAGQMNITVIGYYENGETLQTTKTFEFIRAAEFRNFLVLILSIIIPIILVIVAILIFLYYRRR
jgi:hypothetical protein